MKRKQNSRSPVRLSWERVRLCLYRFEQLVAERSAFIHDDAVWLDMPWSNCLLMLGRERFMVMRREDWTKPLFTALPPVDIQLMTNVIFNKYNVVENTGKVMLH